MGKWFALTILIKIWTLSRSKINTRDLKRHWSLFAWGDPGLSQVFGRGCRHTETTVPSARSLGGNETVRGDGVLPEVLKDVFRINSSVWDELDRISNTCAARAVHSDCIPRLGSSWSSKTVRSATNSNISPDCVNSLTPENEKSVCVTQRHFQGFFGGTNIFSWATPWNTVSWNNHCATASQ